MEIRAGKYSVVAVGSEMISQVRGHSISQVITKISFIFSFLFSLSPLFSVPGGPINTQKDIQREN